MKEEENPWQKRTKRPNTDKNGKATIENKEKLRKKDEKRWETKKNMDKIMRLDGKQ